MTLDNGHIGRTRTHRLAPDTVIKLARIPATLIDQGFPESGPVRAFNGLGWEGLTMSVIVELALPSRQFELGRILELEEVRTVVLETMVPMGERTVPFFRVHGGANGFEGLVRGHSSVNAINVVSRHEDEILYALDWEVPTDSFFDGLLEADATVLAGRGEADMWAFELRFPTHEALSGFRSHCIDHEITIDVLGLYNPTKPDAGPWYGLSVPQRKALTRAVDAGYYSIPRETSTKTLASEFEISDQALTERLRRGIRNLVSSTLHVAEESRTAPAPRNPDETRQLDSGD